MRRINRDLAAAELPPLEWYDVLLALEEAPGHRLRLSELADAALLSRSGMTRLADRLEAAGLLRREVCPNDRRGAFAALTSKGLDLLHASWPVFSGSVRDRFESYLTEEETAVLIRAFDRILEAEEDAAG
jgi:DNA-binding MarR family transcriptional regulator